MQWLLSLVAVLSVASVTACGSKEEVDAAVGAARPTGTVEVVAKDIRFEERAYRAAAGDVHFLYRNDGSITHTLLIEDHDGFKLKVTGHGDVADGSVSLARGSYTLYCDIAGHRQAGMQATLEVD